MEKKVLIVDDHAVMRAGLKLLLQDAFANLQLFEAGDGDEAMEVLRQQHIDILVMDIHIRNTDSISLVELISIRYPKTYILVFSMLPEKVYGRRMLAAGARSYLPKESTLDEIKKAFELVFRRKTYMSQNFAEIMAGAGATQALNPFDQLSRREFEIVNLLLSGASINAIAQSINVKPSTVGTYKARVFEKLRIATVFELKDLAVLYKMHHHSMGF
ncbi:response regulator transcription factor [Flaviaesturariibacter flavus]|uniref:Response regulator transcription factor n=1 Tax=Flaviaesturariibacter flavus TaxID=2502780 RepID=A0A4R1BAH7_9BACT|nr:response regulator transcription factor [Flaviaesturariibacter flavus]TCJ13965.1 response regulator transcription factor [Flaviaesturariibacter flavus]